MPIPGRRTASSLARRLPPVARLVADRDRWRDRAESDRRARADAEALARTAHAGQAFPPGHFYSPIPDLDEVRARHDRLFDRTVASVPGVDVRADAQLALLPGYAELYREQPFAEDPVDGLRYGFRNRFFSYGDGLALYSFLRTVRPARLVEVGSGWSSALALDVNERFLDGGMECTFVEPYAERLHELLRDGDRASTTVIEQPLHAVATEVIDRLEPGDLLFIDSTHVSRIGSDVNQLVLDVLPALPAGVHVHVHDVFWPFEYPADWVYRGRAWNEAYLLRAYLADNPRVRITWFNDYLGHHHADAVAAAMPLWRTNPGGSIYLETV
jgi:hypothetical protein